MVVPDVFARCIPDAHAPWKFVILGHPDLAVGIDCDAGGLQQAARVVGTDPGPSFRLPHCAEKSSIRAENLNLHGGAAVRDHRVPALVEREPPWARQLPGGKGLRRAGRGIDAQKALGRGRKKLPIGLDRDARRGLRRELAGFFARLPIEGDDLIVEKESGVEHIARDGDAGEVGTELLRAEIACLAALEERFPFFGIAARSLPLGNR